jgi:hypothetical protein
MTAAQVEVSIGRLNNNTSTTGAFGREMFGLPLIALLVVSVIVGARPLPSEDDDVDLLGPRTNFDHAFDGATSRRPLC